MVRRVTSRLAIAILVAACGSTAPSATPTPTATPAPTATTATTASPTPAPVDVSAAFIGAITDPTFSASATVAGTLSIGGVEGTISGVAQFDGSASSSSTTLSIGGQEQVSESVKIGDQAWERQSPGPWLAKPASDRSIGSTLAGLTSAVDLGVETIEGQALHHLQPAGGGEISPEVLGFDVEGASDPVFTIDFYATDDGTPVIIAFGGAWTQTSDDGDLAIEMGFAYALGEPSGTVTAPTDVWEIHASKPFKYQMARPADWVVKPSKTQDVYTVGDQPYVYVVPQEVPAGMRLDGFTEAIKADYQSQFGDPDEDVAATLGGEAAQRLIYRFTNEDDTAVTVADYLTVYQGQGWEVFIATGGGDEDVRFFETFVATFEFTD
jgi:hypothetical protein